MGNLYILILKTMSFTKRKHRAERQQALEEGSWPFTEVWISEMQKGVEKTFFFFFFFLFPPCQRVEWLLGDWLEE